MTTRGPTRPCFCSNEQHWILAWFGTRWQWGNVCWLWKWLWTVRHYSPTHFHSSRHTSWTISLEWSPRLYLTTSDSARLCIPRGPLRLKLLQENHDCLQLMAGHPGRDRTYWNLSRHFYWPRMGRDGKAFVRSCESCQRNKSGKIKVGLLQPLPIPDRPWAHISVDFIIGLPQTDLGFNAILIHIRRPINEICSSHTYNVKCWRKRSGPILYQRHLSSHAPPIIHRPMALLNGLIGLWKTLCGPSSIIVKTIGTICCLSASLPLITPASRPLITLHSSWIMDMIHWLHRL